MPLLYEIDDDTAQVQIEGELTIYTAADLAAQWLPRLGQRHEWRWTCRRSPRWTVPVCSCC